MALLLRGHLQFSSITALLLLLTCIPILQGHSLRIDQERLRRLSRESRAPHLKIVEHQYMDHRPSQDGKPANHLNPAAEKREFKRSTSECTQERLTNMLRSCKDAAIPQAANEERDKSTFFCGPACSHQVDEYTRDCTSSNKFIVDVSGACKLGGESPTLECVYAVIVVDNGLTYCARMQQDVDFAHEEAQYLFNRSKQYVDDTCCSLNTTYSDNPSHEVFVEIVDGVPDVTTEPALQPPWLRADDVTDYSAIKEVTRSDLCEKQPVTTTAHTIINSTSTVPPNVILKVEANAFSGAQRISLLSKIICLLALSLTIIAH